jgi:Ca2+-binding EF-hand superfamily protein
MSKALIAMGLVVCLAVSALPAWAESVQKVGKQAVRMKADFNNDGKVSLEEHLAWAKSSFIQMDLDGDGYITPGEIAKMQLEQLASMRAHGDLPPGNANEAQIVPAFKFPADLDTDKDGKVSLAEHLAWETNSFKHNDLNGDGFITAKEIVEREKIVLAEIETKVRLMREQRQAAKPKDVKKGYQN